MRRKHVPQRTCIGCRETKPKREMVRLVRTPEGHLVVDETGKQNGRGAYLCRRQVCWNAALKRKAVSRALKMDVGEQEQQVLYDYAVRLPV